jgi:hypothetical protein
MANGRARAKGYTEGFVKIIADKKNKKFLPDMLESSALLFRDRSFFENETIHWVSSTNDYQFAFDSLPAIIFGKMDLKCYSKGDSSIIAQNMGADLGQSFALGRVDLAGHDGAAGFILWQSQFAQPRTWARAQETDIIGDFKAAHRHRGDGPMGEDHGVMGSQSLKFVRGAGKGQAG